MTTIIARTIIIYALLMLSLKVMGKRQIGELEVSELITTLIISELAAIPIDNPDVPLAFAALPILLMLSIEIILSYLKTKSRKIKSAIDGSPDYLIYRGKLLQGALASNRISADEVISEARIQGVGRISDIEYAVLEQNGKISIIKKKDADDSAMSHTLIIDGTIQKRTLSQLGLSISDIERLAQKSCIEDIFLLCIDDGGSVYLILKEEKE